MKIRTWHVEAAFVVVALTMLTEFTHPRPVDWLALFAVIYTFNHCQVTSRMAEAQADSPEPSVECHRAAAVYWIVKECLWIVYFGIQRSWAAVGGAVIFAAYPAWRRWWRAYK